MVPRRRRRLIGPQARQEGQPWLVRNDKEPAATVYLPVAEALAVVEVRVWRVDPRRRALVDGGGLGGVPRRYRHASRRRVLLCRGGLRTRSRGGACRAQT